MADDKENYRISLRTLRARLKEVEAEEHRRIDRLQAQYQPIKDSLANAIADIGRRLNTTPPNT